MKYMVPLWGVVLLALLACVSILLAVRSSMDSVRARHAEDLYIDRANAVDSAWTDWIKRGCAPRTVGPPP